MNPKIDGMAVSAFVLILFLGVILGTDVATTSPQPIASSSELSPIKNGSSSSGPERFAAPYTSYTLTQGPHGSSYGHMAVDLAAGEGTHILSPITGRITGSYTDVYGNPTLVIENKVYQVTLMHGKYTAALGQSVTLGEVVGSESNLGYTTDMAGNPCWERPGCGAHTHLNVFDKRLGMNVNPLDLLP
jgi:murein DD-endopeptidase MepM/ murein hydrolase activator NlpD